MKPLLLACLSAMALLIPIATAAESVPRPPIPWQVEENATLRGWVDAAVTRTVSAFAAQKLEASEMAVTVVDLQDTNRLAWASHRGDVPVYPASVVKLFYLAAAHQWMEEGRLQDTEELRRALRDMIVDSYNEATHYVVDLLTGTTSGPELPAEELTVWFNRRNAVNRYFASLGYTGINANKKPWCEGPYGRETQAIKAFEPKRNQLTTQATARLVTEIALGRAVSPARSTQMLALMRRDPRAETTDPDDQAKFTGPVLPAGAKLWSKAGWTSETRHDAACLELPNGRRLVLVVFTVNHANERGIIHRVARDIVGHFSAPAR
jgi:beta-lactamase class A